VSFRDALSPDLAKRTFDCWVRLRAGGRVPKKDELCPLGLPPAVLPYLILMEHIAGEEFRCRLIGSSIRDWYGTNVVGKSMRDLIPPEAHEERAPLLRHCIGEGAPAWFAGPLLINGEPIRHGGRLMLPVAFRGDAPDGILLVLFVDAPGSVVGDLSIAIDTSFVCPRRELA